MADIPVPGEEPTPPRAEAPLRVLHLGKYFPPHAGGMETYLRDLMTEQARQGLEPHGLVHSSEIGLTTLEENYAAGELTLPVTRVAVWARLLFTPISPAFPLWLSRLIGRYEPDVLHLHLPNPAAFWALAMPRARRIPWILHWHSDVLASRHSLGLRLFYALYRPFEQAILRRSAAIIATSPRYLESSQTLAQWRDKCSVVPLGIDPRRLDAKPGSEPVPDRGGLRVLAIGRLTYYKGFENLVRAAALVEGLTVRIVGSGDLAKPLRKLASDIGAAQQVTFLGSLSDDEVAREYRHCDCLCLPSIERTEAFGLVLLEAMYFGKATVISDVPGSGMGWIVDQGVTGLKVPAESAEALVDAFRQLQSDRDTLARLGSEGRRKFDQQFHISQSARQISGLYVNVLARDD